MSKKFFVSIKKMML